MSTHHVYIFGPIGAEYVDGVRALDVAKELRDLVAALRRSSRETVDGALRTRRAMSRTPAPCALRIAISSRSAKGR